MSMFESWKPEDLPPRYDGKFDITDSGQWGIDSGRTRWRVVCKQCGEELHPATTDPSFCIKTHECPMENATEIH